MKTSKIQNGCQGIWKGVYSRQLLLNRFFDPSTPSMRKVDGGGNGKNRGRRGVKEEKMNVGNSGHYNVASQPHKC